MMMMSFDDNDSQENIHSIARFYFYTTVNLLLTNGTNVPRDVDLFLNYYPSKTQL